MRRHMPRRHITWHLHITVRDNTRACLLRSPLPLPSKPAVNQTIQTTLHTKTPRMLEIYVPDPYASSEEEHLPSIDIGVLSRHEHDNSPARTVGSPTF